MFDEMRAAGSTLPDMVELLQVTGWKTYQHHDNWIHSEFPHGMSTHEAYEAMRKYHILSIRQIIDDGWNEASMNLKSGFKSFEKDNFMLIVNFNLPIPFLRFILKDVTKVIEKMPDCERWLVCVNVRDINQFRQICKMI